MPDRNLDTFVKECMFHTSLFFHEILNFYTIYRKINFILAYVVVVYSNIK